MAPKIEHGTDVTLQPHNFEVTVAVPEAYQESSLFRDWSVWSIESTVSSRASRASLSENLGVQGVRTPGAHWALLPTLLFYAHVPDQPKQTTLCQQSHRLVVKPICFFF